MGGFTFGVNQNISAKIFAYNTSIDPPIGLNASQENVTIKVYDSTGKEVTSVTSSASAVSNGQGSINITMPSVLGFYEIVVSVKTDGCKVVGCTNNTVGVADNWIQVSNLNVKISTDRQSYQPTDNVYLTVQVSNATSGELQSGVSIEVIVDTSSTPALGVTDANGNALITLNASTHSGSTSWSYGWHNLRIKISKDAGSNFETWFGFNVKGFDLNLWPERPSYQQGENVTIIAYGSTQGISIIGVKVDGTTLAGGDNNVCPPVPNVTFCTSEAFGSGSNRIEIGSWPVGHHNVEITVSTTGGQQKFYTGFNVNLFNIIVTTDKFSYDLNENITLTIKANYPNGTAVSNKNVNATLYKAQPPNDIYVTQGSGTTNSNGQTIIKLNATQPGFNYVKINIDGQLQFIGVQVSSLKVTLIDSLGGNVVTNYTSTSGGSFIIYVNATSGGQNVPDGSLAKATLWSYGNSIELSQATFTNGNATINSSFSLAARTYGLEVRVITPNGDQGFAQPSTLTVTGGESLRLSVSTDRPFSNPYKIGDIATLTAVVAYANDTGVSDQNVTFEIGSEGSTPQIIGTALSGSGGIATKSFNITSNYSDGSYFVHAYLTNSTDVQSYSGFMISSLKVLVVTDKNTYSIGENVTLNVTVLNRTGSQVNATSLFVIMFNKDKGQLSQQFTPSGNQPYQLSISMPNESSAVGTYPIAVIAYLNQSQGIGFAMINVKNQSLTLNLTLPSTIRAGEPFLANISSSLNGTATLRIFSPTASSLLYENTSINLSTEGIPNASVNLTISNPGVYVFNVFVSGIGSTTSIITVLSPLTGTIPSMWTGTSLTSNASTFTTSNDVYIMSNVANATATILSIDESTGTTITASVSLSTVSSGIYYGVYNQTNLVSGRKYFVRLDTTTSTGIANTMFTVS